MAAVNDFEDLRIWQRANVLATEIYRLTSQGDFMLDYRFKSQIRAAAGSIMDNIAEGFERNGNKEFINFLYMAKGSCGEVRSQLHRAKNVGFISQEDFDKYRDEVFSLSKSIYAYIYYLKKSEQEGKKGLKYDMIPTTITNN